MGLPVLKGEMDESTSLEFHLLLKHIHQALHQHEGHLKKIHKLQDKIHQNKDSDEDDENHQAMLSAKAAAKLLQAYEAALRSVDGLTGHFQSASRKIQESEYKEVEDDEASEQLEEPSLHGHEVDIEGIDQDDDEKIIVESDCDDQEEAKEDCDDQDGLEVDGNDASNLEGDGELVVGTLVAVLCKVEEDSESEEWILAIIKQFNAAEQIYEVEDCETTGEIVPNGKRRTCESSKIIALPTAVEEQPEEEEFKPKTAVLALFPGTTCLYPAVVISTPSRRRKTRDYLLRFQDDEVPSRTCPARFVTASPNL